MEAQNQFPNRLPKSSKARKKPQAPYYWQISTKPISYKAIIQLAPFSVERYSTTQNTVNWAENQMFTTMANAAIHTDTLRTTLRHDAYSRSSNASSHATSQRTQSSCIEVSSKQDTHISCTRATNQITTQLRLTYSPNLIQLKNYTYLLTKS